MGQLVSDPGTTASWVLLISGAGLGGTVTAVVGWVVARSGWRREDRHRFTAMKRDLYERFIRAQANLIAIESLVTPSDEPTFREISTSFFRLYRNARKLTRAEADLKEVHASLVLLAPRQVHEPALAIDNADPGDEKWVRLAQFAMAARSDLGAHQSRAPEWVWRRRKRQRDVKLRETLEQGPLNGDD